MKKKVTILLSTYNGEKYLEEQLQSIYNQTYFENCTLFVRDDGSKDGTVSILKKHEAEGKLILTCGENIGFVKSFFYLIKNAPEADYYSFSDQDDVWKKEKVQRAVEMLENTSQLPSAYYSDYDIIDAQGKIKEKHHKTTTLIPTFFNAMTMNQSSGFTMLINSILRKELIKINVKQGQYHDYWAYLIAIGFGNLIYDNYTSAFYRRYENNESGEILKGLPLVKNALSHSFLKKNFALFYSTLLDFKEIFYPQINSINKKILNLFINKTKKNQLTKFFYPEKYRKRFYKDFFCRLLCILRII
jgi:glycosyltransferase involved in cell wall biosynthesis